MLGFEPHRGLAQAGSRRAPRGCRLGPARTEPASITLAFLDKLFSMQGKFPHLATQGDYLALAYAVRDLALHRWSGTAETYTTKAAHTVAYFSAEYLLGPPSGEPSRPISLP